ncbi:ATP-dependent Clp protease adaptor ClpS [bacterium]|nr:MAG: ATP-dependent Clp protease adaptor ClpS [bacterium]
MAENPLVELDLIEKLEQKNELKAPWNCILFNDDFHTFDEVIYQIMIATGYVQEKAEQIAMNAHSAGKAVVYSGEAEECLRISAILEEIFLLTEVQG